MYYKTDSVWEGRRDTGADSVFAGSSLFYLIGQVVNM